MTPFWQRRRNEFNHGWLKNRFLVPLNKWLSMLEGEIEDKSFEALFIVTVLPQWESQRWIAIDLARAFESEMSPRQILRKWPIAGCGCASYQWLEGLTHRLWLARVPVRRWVAEAINAVEGADAAYAKVQIALKNCSSPPTAQNLAASKSVFKGFRDACQDVGAKFSRFPGEIAVV